MPSKEEIREFIELLKQLPVEKQIEFYFMALGAGVKV